MGQTERTADPGAVPDHRRRSLPPQSPYQGSEGYPWNAVAGARSPGTAAPAPALRAAEQGPVSEERLGCDGFFSYSPL